MVNVDYEAFGGLIQDFDDGHVPENLIGMEASTTTMTTTTTSVNNPTKLVYYPRFFDRPPAVHIFQDAMPPALVDALYEKTFRIQTTSQTPWGAYVTVAQVQDFWKSKANCDNRTNHDDDDDDDNNISNNKGKVFVEDPVLEATAHFLELAMGRQGRSPTRIIPPSSSSNNEPISSLPLWTADDLAQAHGVAVWALCAKPGSEVPYHLDYAEQVRYETGVIVPPLLAGTLHCTRDVVEGGAFQVALDGITHYQQYGYKCKKMIMADSTMMHGLESIPYHYNQVTCHAGHLPHASSKIIRIHGSQDRVIVGFNVFAPDIGPIVERAPEHSDTFRKMVKLQRWYTSRKGNTKHQTSLDLQTIQRNRPLTKLLVLAKQEWENEFAAYQQE